jgi:hypothetical protein
LALLLPQSDTEQAVALSRRLRAAFEASIEPLNLGIALALDYGLAVYPDDGETQKVLIDVADERLYQFKKDMRSQAGLADTAPTARATVPERSEPVAAAPKPAAEPPRVSAAKKVEYERRRWERVSLANTHAYALIGEGAERTARVVDLGYGGVALETTKPEDVSESFHAVLHVPILPPVRVSLRRIYLGQGTEGAARVGCSFVT